VPSALHIGSGITAFANKLNSAIQLLVSWLSQSPFYVRLMALLCGHKVILLLCKAGGTIKCGHKVILLLCKADGTIVWPQGNTSFM
jgi:hypothetical protein